MHGLPNHLRAAALAVAADCIRDHLLEESCAPCARLGGTAATVTPHHQDAHALALVALKLGLCSLELPDQGLLGVLGTAAVLGGVLPTGSRLRVEEHLTLLV